MQFNLLVLKTPDPEPLKNQYELLGLKFKYHQHSTGPFHYSTMINEVLFEIYPLPKSNESADNTTRLGFSVNNLDELLQQLKSSNWKIKSQAAQTDWGYVAVIEDLDSRKVELKQV